MAVKLTMFFSIRRELGFSETWYNESTNDPNALDVTNLQNLYTTRMRISGVNTFADGLRISSVTPPRLMVNMTRDDMVAAEIPVQGTFPAVAQGDNTSDFGDTAILLGKGYGTPANFTGRFFFRGQPDSVCNVGGQFQDVNGWLGLLGAYQNALNVGGWGWYERRTNLAGTPARITDAAQDAQDGTITFTCQGTPFATLTVGSHQNATIRGQILPPTLNGRLTVVILSANTCKTIKFMPLGPFAGSTGKMTIKAGPTFRLLRKLKLVRVVERKGGRPSNPYRGRSKPGQAV